MDKKIILKNIEEAELAGNFNCHVHPINYNHMKPVDANYDFLRKNFFLKAGSFFVRPVFSLASFCFKKGFKLKVIGKENLKGIKKGIVTSNHIHDLDCALIKSVLQGKKVYYTVGDFNNFKGIGGSFLRAAGTMPFSDKFVCMKNLLYAVEELLKKDTFVVFYPEGSLWWCYEKPRPTIGGAFQCAAKNNVPIIPLFFTFKNRKLKKNGIYKKEFTLHILKPIYPDKNKTPAQNKTYLQQAHGEVLKNLYEEVYNKKLEFTCDKKCDKKNA